MINDKTEWRCHYCHLVCVLSSVWVKRWGQDCVWSVGLDNSLLARSFNFLLSKSKTHTFINFCFPFFALISYSEEMQKNLTWTRTRRFLILLLLQQKHSKVEFRDKQIFCSLEYQIKKSRISVIHTLWHDVGRVHS